MIKKKLKADIFKFGKHIMLFSYDMVEADLGNARDVFTIGINHNYGVWET